MYAPMITETTWLKLANKHYGGAGSRPRRCTLVAATPARMSELRRWLSDDVVGSRFMPGFVTVPALEWPVYEARWSRPTTGVRLTVLAEPGPGRLASAERFVRDELLPALLSTVAMLRSYSEAWRRPDVDVYYVDTTTHDRRLPLSPGSPVMPEHINGGVTMHVTGRVLVYRREDAGKVLLHELLHLHGLDRALQLGHPSIERRLRAEFGVVAVDPTCPLGIYEAYTETMACYLRAIWVAHARGNKSPASALRRVASQVMTIADRTTAHFGGTLAYVEGTHCFAYVACRAALWRPPYLDRMLAAYPPGRPPSDAEAFAAFLTEALRAYAASLKADRRRPEALGLNR